MWILEKNTPQQPGGLKQRVIGALLYCTGEMKQLHTHIQGKRPPSYSTQHSANVPVLLNVKVKKFISSQPIENIVVVFF